MYCMDNGSATRSDITYQKSPEPRGRCGGNSSSVWFLRGVIKVGSNVVSCAISIMTVMLWTLLIALPSLICALPDTQIPFHIPADNIMVAHGSKATFRFKEGSDVFTPKDLVELSRPGPGVANVPGDLILVPVSKYSFEEKKYVHVSSSLSGFRSPVITPPLPPPPTRVFGVRGGCPCLLPDVRAQQIV